MAEPVSVLFTFCLCIGGILEGATTLLIKFSELQKGDGKENQKFRSRFLGLGKNGAKIHKKHPSNQYGASTFDIDALFVRRIF